MDKHDARGAPGSKAAGAALAGIRVLDFSRVLAAPWATQILADFGADVVKVEHPGRGDDARGYPPFLFDEDHREVVESAFHVCANRNKRSIALDLANPQAQSIAKALVRECDVVVENFIAGTLDKFGLGFEALRAENPGLIYCSLTGFGQDGPYSKRPGYDAVFQAQGGMMMITGHEDGTPGAGPMKTGPSLVDVTAGYNAVIGVLIALVHRERTGKGQHIDIALFDTAMAMQSHVVQGYLITGKQPPRLGNCGNGGHPAAVFACADGPIYISAGNQRHYESLCDVLGMPELKQDERFRTSLLRFEHRAQWNAIVEPRMRLYEKHALAAALVAARVPVSVVNTYDEAFRDPHILHRGVKVDLDYPAAAGGTVSVVANPVRMSSTPAAYRTRPPRLGEHTEEVLREFLHLADDELRDLRDKGVI